MKRKVIKLNFLLGIMIIFLGSDIWAQTNSFRCYANYQGQQIELSYASPMETYMANGTIADLEIETFDNENNCYSVQVSSGGELLSSSTLPYYEDARMLVGHRGSHLTVQCQK